MPRKARAIHRRGQRLRAAHSAEAAADNEFACRAIRRNVFARRGEGFERALHDSLAADVDPRTGGHLSIHR